MTTRREFIKLAAMGGFGLFLPLKIDLSRVSPRVLANLLPPVNGADVAGKFSMPLIIPPAMPRTTKIKQKMAKNIDYYEIAVRQFTQQILPSGNPTTVWSYGSVNHPGTFNYPAFTIEAKYNKPVKVKWINDLKDQVSGTYLPHLLAVDQTLHWANPPGGTAMRDMRGMDPNPYTGPVPIVTHVHGAHVGEESDGYAEAWYLPKATNIPEGYATGGTWYGPFAAESLAKYGLTWEPGSSFFDYPNDQRASTLWYHDHTLGMTRLNVYAGPAGFYLIRGGPSDQVLDGATGLPAVLPGPAPALGDLPGVQYFEIPIAIQDRCFDEYNQLWYPDNRAFFEGLAEAQLQIPFIPADACGGPSDISPIWNPEFFGNVMVVNGHAWPFLNVEAKRYRFRFLNGCNSRFLILQNDAGLPFHVIGTEGGFLPAPATLNQLLMSPAERMDTIMDFSGLPVGTVVTLTNIGPDEPFGGGLPWFGDPTEVPEGYFPVADPFSTGKVMQFIVGPAGSPDLSTPVNQLVLPAHAPLPSLNNPVRQVSLNELDSHTVFFSVDGDGNFLPDCSGDPFGPMEAQLGTMEPDSIDPTTLMPMPMEWMHPITENPAIGSTEIWEIFNFTMDAHPIHLHQVQFEVVERQSLMDPTMVTPPEPWEIGLKDTVIAYPDQITRIRAHFDLPGLYVWHCHIVEHEDNEMMRPFYIGQIPPELLPPMA